MDLTKEQVRKIMECKTADELLALAKSWGVEMTREQAEDYVANMKTVELTESELKQVAGGDEGDDLPWCDYICRELFCPDVNQPCVRGSVVVVGHTRERRGGVSDYINVR